MGDADAPHDRNDHAPKRGALVLLAVVLCGAALFALRTTPPTEALTPRAVGAAREAAPVVSASAEAEDESAPTGKPEPPIDPAATAVPRPDDRAPDCEAPLVVLSEKGAGGRVRHGCARTSDAGEAVRVGRWTVVEGDGRIQTGYYENGLQQGEWTTWYPNGTRTKVQPFEAGVLNGVQIEWLPSGQRFAERTYKHGTLDGPVTLTYPDGTTSHEDWRQGVRISQSQTTSGL